jgi:hypothetical protein
MQIVIGTPAALTALVLGRLIASVKTARDHAGRDLQVHAPDLKQFDRCLPNHGRETNRPRDLL